MNEDTCLADRTAFAVIVPAFNEALFLGKTLARIKSAIADTGLPAELIVVDNNSTDGTAEIAREAGASVVYEPENQISRARNAGAHAATAPYLVFVDADTEIDGELLKRAIRTLDERAACGGGALLQLDREHRLGNLVTACWNMFARRAKFAAGCFLFCRRDGFESVGGFSERVYASEEIWLTIALKKWGKVVGRDFVIIERAVTTSARKLDWLSGGEIFKQFIVLLCFPFALRSRRFCSAWYRRPSARNRASRR